MATPDDGLATVAYAPCEVKTVVKGGLRVTITEDTDYPFRDKIRLHVEPASQAQFPLQLRIPAWSQDAAVTVNGKPLEGVKAGTFYKIAREWRKGDLVELAFPMSTRISRWYQNSLAIERGPLVFCLKVGEDWRKIRDKAPAADWEVHPTTAWNYGLIIDTANPERSVQVVERSLAKSPFTPDGAPVELKVKGRRLPQWKLDKGSAGPLPSSPVSSQEPVETVSLIPYGSAKLRITAFPQVRE